MSNTDLPLILSIETATRAGSLALSRGDSLLASRAGSPEVSHSNDLLQHTRDLFDEAKVSLSEVDIFAVSIGPGSFTGLRIGIATVKSFAATLSRPCVGIQTLEAIAHAAGQSPRTVALLPAGRGELFAQTFKVDKAGVVRSIDDATHITPAALLDQQASQTFLLWAGEGAQLSAVMIRERALVEGIELIEAGPEALPVDNLEGKRLWLLAPVSGVLAESVGALAFQRFRAGTTVAAEDLQAVYVRPSDAELKEKF